MATAKELFQQGELAAAITQLISDVKARPTDTSARIFLFELLCFAGEWDRAERQLDVVATQGGQAGALPYLNCVKAERQRQRMWTEGAEPHFLFDPPDSIDLHSQAIAKTRAGDFAAARLLLDRAEEQRPAQPGTCDGTAFYDLRDADDFIAPVLEMAVKDQYAWIPFAQLRSITIAKPTQIRDLLYTHARIEAADGTMAEGFLLSLYAGSSAHENDSARLGRMTDWNAYNDELACGMGAKLWMVGDADVVVFEVQFVEFEASENEAAE